MKKYEIEIYSPGSVDDTIGSFESSTPFMNFSVEEILNPSFMSSYDGNPQKLLKITGVEHIIWQHEGQEEPIQKVLIYTREIKNDRSKLEA